MHRSPASFASKSTGRALRHRGAAAFLSDPTTATAPMAHATAPLPPGASMIQGPVPCVPAVVRVGAKIGGHAVVPRVGGEDGLAGAPAAAGSMGTPSAPTTATSMAGSESLQAFVQASEAAPVAPPVKTREVPPPLPPKVEQLQAIARKCTLAPAHGPLADAPPAAVVKDGAALPRYVVNPFSGRNTLAIAPAVQALRRLGFRSAGRHSPHLVHDGSLAGLVAAASVSAKSVNGVAVVEGESLRTRLAAVVAAAGGEAQVQQQHSILAEALRPIPEFVQRAIPAALRQTVKSPAEDPCLAGLDHDTKVYVQAVSKAVAFVSRASTAKHAELIDSFGMPPVPTPAEVALRVAQWQGSPQPDGIQGAAPEVLVNPRQSLTPEQRSVLALITSGRSVYIGGSAGTGKSALLRMVAATLAHERGLNVALTATTGVAALTIGGTTFHRVFRPTSDMGSFSAAALRYFDAVVLDEVSMLGAEALTNFDLSARAARGVDAPFGGLQMITCGDFLQLHIDAATGQPVLRDKARPAASVLELPPPKKERPSVSRAVARATKAFLAEVKARDLALPLPTKASPKGKDTNARDSLDTAEGQGVAKGKGKDGRGSHVFDSPSFAALVPLRLTATLRHKTDPRFASCLTLLRTGAVARGILERCAKDLDDLPPPMRCPKAHAEAALSLTAADAAAAGEANGATTNNNNNNNGASQPVHAGSRPPVYLFSTRAAAEEHNQRWVGHCGGATHVFEPKYYVMTVGGALEVEGWAEVAVKDPAEQEPAAKPRRRHAPSVAQRREARSGLQAAIAEALGVAPRDITLSPDAALAAAVMYTTATPASRRQNASVTVKCRVGKHHAHGQRKHAGHHASRRFAIADDAVRHLRNALRRSATFLADERTDLSEVVPAAAPGDDADGTAAANLLGAGASDVQGERTAAADAKGRELLRTRVFRSGCRVMLLYNLSATLVNGSLGTFVGTVSYDPQLLPKGLRRALHPEGNVTHVRGAAKNRRLRLPMVRFDNGEEVVVPHVPVTAPVASPSHELCARAAVVPLGLAYGFTVHKVQGITLDAPVVLDLQQARWKCEHLVYVAASRVRRLQQLNIVNFSRSHVQVNPRVLAFVRQLERASVVCKAMSGLDGKLAATGVDAVAVRDTALPKTPSKAAKAQATTADAASEVRAGCTPLQVSLLPAAGLSTWAVDAAQDPTVPALASSSGGGGAPPPAPTAPASPAS